MPNAVSGGAADRLFRMALANNFEPDTAEAMLGARITASAAKTNAQRQREFRARQAEQQATEVRGIFAHPDDHAEIKEAAAKIGRRRARLAKRAAA